MLQDVVTGCGVAKAFFVSDLARRHRGSPVMSGDHHWHADHRQFRDHGD